MFKVEGVCIVTAQGLNGIVCQYRLVSIQMFCFYHFVSLLRLEFILRDLAALSYSRFRRILREGVMKSMLNEGGSLLSQVLKCIAVV